MDAATQLERPDPVGIPDELVDHLSSLRRPIIIGHVRPDADCLGSMFGVALTWPGDGAGAARVSLPDGSISKRLQFMVDWAKAPVATQDDFKKADGFVVVDTARRSRCNVDRSLGEDVFADRVLINIDHHASNKNFGNVNWVDPHAGSASELVYQLIRTTDRPISSIAASLLYAGIHSDTLGFSLPSTTPETLRAAADLVACGARVSDVGDRLIRSQTQAEFDLHRIIYDNTRIVADGRIAYSTAGYDEITRSGCTRADIDDQVSIPRSLRGIEIAILLTEGTPGKTRLNIRGESGLNVLTFAESLGGGGHTVAAGAIVNGDIDVAVERVIPAAIAYLDAATRRTSRAE